MTAEGTLSALSSPEGRARPGSSPIPVGVIGAAGRRALATAKEGAVLAVFQRSFYLECAGGGLVCFGPASIDRGPLNAVCAVPERADSPAWRVRPGAAASLDAGFVRVAGGPSFSLGGANEWRPPPPPRAWRPAELGRGLAMLAHAACQRAPDQGLGALIPALAAGRSLPTSPAGPARPLLRAAAPGLAALAQWLARWARHRGDAIPPPPSEVENLIGLGPGLTPSGDDALAGAMIALHTFSQAPLATRLAAWALPRAAAGTGKISRAHLAAAAEGEGAGALHDVLAALSAPDAVSLATCLDGVARIGHCSGWDALAGSAAACAALAWDGSSSSGIA